MITRFALAATATILTLASFAHAGPGGRDLDRDAEGSSYKAPRELPRSMNADQVYFDTRQDRDFGGSGGKSTCYKVVAVDRSTGEEQVLGKCLSGDQKEINAAIDSYEQEARSARANGSRMPMRGHEFDQAETDQQRSHRHRDEFR